MSHTACTILCACVLVAAGDLCLSGTSNCAFDDTGLLQVKQELHHVPEVAPKRPYYWAGKNGDAQRTGKSTFSVPSSLEAGPAWSWHEEGNGVIRAAPLIDADRNIYLSTIKGGIHKFTPDGQILWSHQDKVWLPGVPAIMDGTLFSANAHGYVFALDMETGKELWRVKGGQQTAFDTWSVSAADGVVVVPISHGAQDLVVNDIVMPNDNQHLRAFDAKDGSRKWTFTPEKIVYNVLTVVKDGSLLFSDHTGTPYRLNLADGKLIWKAPRAGGEEVSPGFSTGGTVLGPNGVVYTTSNTEDKKGWVTAFNFEDGAMLWRRSVEYEANNGAAVGHLTADGTGRLAVVIGVGENPDMADPGMEKFHVMPQHEKKGRVVALDALTGDKIWSHELPGWHGWGAGDSMVKGQEHVCLPDSFGNTAIGGDGTVYVGNQNGRFYAIRDKNGDGIIDDGKNGDGQSEASTFDTGNAFQGSPGIAPGMLVATPCNGMHVFKEKAS